MPSEAAKEATRRAWRELGFFCGRDKAAKEWRIVGSVKGLRKFASEIRKYASNPANDRLSEYTQFGPAMNLEVGTSHQTEITEQWIGGPLVDLLRLATLIERSAQDNVIGKRLALRSNFSPMAPYELILDVRDETFDPALADSTSC
ncbi:MAG: hypothetical protein JJE16_16095 [Nitrospiraceae bacterium]|nr:hypothetical protein [Nitrospiraceae bacterium]